MIEGIGVPVAIEAAKAGLSAGVDKLRHAKQPQIKDVRFQTVLPRRIGIPRALSQEEQKTATFGELENAAFEDGIWSCRWIDCAEFFFRVENIDKSKSVHIKSIHIESSAIDDSPEASLLEEVQGTMIGGECLRFVSMLDGSVPTMQRYVIEDCKVKLLDERNYFDCSTIEIPPGAGVNIALSLVVGSSARRISEISVVYGEIGRSELSVSCVALESDIGIYPLCMVPDEQRFRSTFSSLNRQSSGIATEDDESIIPRSNQKCQWASYIQELTASR